MQLFLNQNNIKLLPSEVTPYYKHFIIIGKVPNSEDNMKFWTIDRFHILMLKKLKNSPLKQGGKILWNACLRAQIKNENEIELVFIFAILFEKRVNLCAKFLFELYYYDIETDKSYEFKNYFFIKETKYKLYSFFDVLFENNSSNVFEYIETEKIDHLKRIKKQKKK